MQKNLRRNPMCHNARSQFTDSDDIVYLLSLGNTIYTLYRSASNFTTGYIFSVSLYLQGQLIANIILFLQFKF